MGKQESPSQNNNATPNHNAEILERDDIYHPSIDQRKDAQEVKGVEN